jgi:hypothetical protein
MEGSFILCFYIWKVGYLFFKTFVFKAPYFFCLDLYFFFFIIIFFLTPQISLP